MNNETPPITFLLQFVLAPSIHLPNGKNKVEWVACTSLALTFPHSLSVLRCTYKLPVQRTHQISSAHQLLFTNRRQHHSGKSHDTHKYSMRRCKRIHGDAFWFPFFKKCASIRLYETTKPHSVFKWAVYGGRLIPTQDGTVCPRSHSQSHFPQ